MVSTAWWGHAVDQPSGVFIGMFVNDVPNGGAPVMDTFGDRGKLGNSERRSEDEEDESNQTRPSG